MELVHTRPEKQQESFIEGVYKNFEASVNRWMQEVVNRFVDIEQGVLIWALQCWDHVLACASEALTLAAVKKGRLSLSLATLSFSDVLRVKEIKNPFYQIIGLMSNRKPRKYYI